VADNEHIGIDSRDLLYPAIRVFWAIAEQGVCRAGVNQIKPGRVRLDFIVFWKSPKEGEVIFRANFLSETEGFGCKSLEGR
jgi:hypothetical protein